MSCLSFPHKWQECIDHLSDLLDQSEKTTKRDEGKISKWIVALSNKLVCNEIIVKYFH